jgi:hypothetical protein
MPSPVGFDHGEAEVIVATWLGVYIATTPECKAGSNTTTIVGGNSPQPDVHLRLVPEVGGRTKKWRKLLRGAPELTAEVCVSINSYDLNQKLELYRRSKIYEYVAILMYEQEIRWHKLVRGRYQLLRSDDDGVFHSEKFPGLWLDGPALLAGDMAGVLATLQEGLQSPEHEEFVRELERRRSP